MLSLIRRGLLLAPIFIACVGAAPAPVPGQPQYDQEGRIQFPADYRTWVFLSSGLNMSYSPNPAMADHDMFGNTFVPAAAYAEFQKTGHWPDKTVIMLENRGGTSQGSINKRGLFQTTEFMGAEAHVRDEARFKGGWAFFAFDSVGTASREIPHAASCYACHQQHAAVDTTFVQFYPTLLPTATRLKTLSPSYLAELAPSAGH